MDPINNDSTCSALLASSALYFIYEIPDSGTTSDVNLPSLITSAFKRAFSGLTLKAMLSVAVIVFRIGTQLIKYSWALTTHLIG